jgi:hypothetical protein
VSGTILPPFSALVGEPLSAQDFCGLPEVDKGGGAYAISGRFLPKTVTPSFGTLGACSASLRKVTLRTGANDRLIAHGAPVPAGHTPRPPSGLT